MSERLSFLKSWAVVISRKVDDVFHRPYPFYYRFPHNKEKLDIDLTPASITEETWSLEKARALGLYGIVPPGYKETEIIVSRNNAGVILNAVNAALFKLDSPHYNVIKGLEILKDIRFK